jgi:hypothetical protein
MDGQRNLGVGNVWLIQHPSITLLPLASNKVMDGWSVYSLLDVCISADTTSIHWIVPFGKDRFNEWMVSAHRRVNVCELDSTPVHRSVTFGK